MHWSTHLLCGVAVIIAAHERVPRTQRHPARAQRLAGIAPEAAHIGAGCAWWGQKEKQWFSQTQPHLAHLRRTTSRKQRRLGTACLPTYFICKSATAGTAAT